MKTEAMYTAILVDSVKLQCYLQGCYEKRDPVITKENEAFYEALTYGPKASYWSESNHLMLNQHQIDMIRDIFDPSATTWEIVNAIKKGGDIEPPTLTNYEKSFDNALTQGLKSSINHPDHYEPDGNHECIDVIEDWGLGFHLGNVLKYICRAGKKGDELEDLRKAAWYLNRRIDRLIYESDVKFFHKDEEEE